MAIAFVNNVAGLTDNSSHTTRTLTLAITSGNLVIVSGTFGDNGSRDSTVTCVDNLGTPTVYNLWLYTYDTANGQALFTFWGIATTTGTATITISAGSATTFWRYGATQYSGSFPATPIDGISSNLQSFTAGTDNLTSLAKTSANNGDLVYGCLMDDSTGTSTFTAGTGFNTIRITQNGGVAFGVEDKIQSSAGSIAATFTSNTTGTKAAIHMLVFSETSSNGGSGNPRIFADFENSTDGTGLTTTILNSGTHNLDAEVWGNGSGGPSFSAMKVATAAEKTLAATLTLADGSSFTDSSGTRGVTFDVSLSTSQYAALAWDMRSPTAIIRYWFKSNIPTNDTGSYAMGFIAAQTGSSEFLSLLLRPQGGTGPLLEMAIHTFTGAGPDVGSALLYTANTSYWIEMKYVAAQAGNSHSLCIYDASGTLLSTQTRTINSGTDHALPSVYRLGRVGDSGTPSALVYIDDLVIDGVNAVFPIPPPVAFVPDQGDYILARQQPADQTVTVWQ